MGIFGNLLGQGAGALGSMLMPIPGVNGQQLGGHIGNMMPFKKGGVVPAHKIMGYARGGEVTAKGYQRGGRVRKSKAGKRKGKK